MLGNLHYIDIFIILLDFAIILWIAWWVSKGGGRNKGERDSTDYFLAGKSAGWFVIGASLFASNIGSEIIIGVSGAGARGEMPQANFEIIAALVLILLGWLFVPFYLRSGVYTMPEFLEIRYSKACRNYLSVISVLAYVITKISLIIFAGALVFETMGISFWTGAIITIVATGFYTILGGLRAVIYTDMIQTFILLAGTGAVTYFGLHELGGWDAMMETISEASLQPGNPSTERFFNLWRSNDDTSYPWTGMLFGAPILGVWYWCTDQFIVHRTLSAKDISNARKGTLFAGFLKLLPVFLFFLPGVIAYALAQKGMLSFSLDNPDKALPAMINGFLPVGIKGLAISGLLAALMSSLSSLFNSCASLFTIDIYEKIHPKASERHLVSVGRVATVVVVAMGIVWIPVMQRISEGGLYKYLQSVQGYLAPPITAVFMLGLFCKRINGKGAVAGLAIGFIVGMAKLIIQALTGGDDPVITSSWLVYIGEYNFLFATGWLLLISILSIVGVSLLTAPPEYEKIAELTYATITPEQRREIRESWGLAEVLLTVLVLGLVLGLYIYFSFWLR